MCAEEGWTENESVDKHLRSGITGLSEIDKVLKEESTVHYKSAVD